VNSSSILTEEKPPTSSVELEEIQPYRMPRMPIWYSPDLGRTAIPVLAPEVNIVFVTASGIDISAFYPGIIVLAPKTQVLFQNRASTETLLGDKGKRLLERLISLIEDTSCEKNWPLIRVEVNCIKDVEVRDWQYILLILVFDSDFDSADKYLRDFYKILNLLTDTLDKEEQDIFRRMLYFDVGTTL